MTPLSDETIAAQVQQGDAQAFGALVSRYEPKLLRYARKYLFGREDAEDLVQEVFLKAYRNMQSFDAARRFSPWIYRIAHNVFINALKQKSRIPFFSLDLDTLFPHPRAKETADGDLQREELKTMLDACLGAMDAKYREILVLSYFEELSYQEIADVLRIPISTVGVRLARGRTALRRAFAARITPV